MTTYNLQLKNEQKWLMENSIHMSRADFQSLSAGAQKLRIIHGEKLKLNTPESQKLAASLDGLDQCLVDIHSLWSDMESIAKKTNSGYQSTESLIFRFPRLNTTDKIKTAFCGVQNVECDLSETIKGLESFQKIKTIFSPYLPLYYHIPVERDVYYNTATQGDALARFFKPNVITTIKRLQEIQAKIQEGRISVVFKNAKNSFLEKKSWAIFYQHSNKPELCGYFDKDNELGDISSARLFDSDVGALNAAHSLGVLDCDVVQVQISFKQRTGLHPNFHSTQLDEMEALIEKEKINTMFESMGIDQIEAKLLEMKSAKNRHKV